MTGTGRLSVVRRAGAAAPACSPRANPSAQRLRSTRGNVPWIDDELGSDSSLNPLLTSR